MCGIPSAPVLSLRSVVLENGATCGNNGGMRPRRAKYGVPSPIESNAFLLNTASAKAWLNLLPMPSTAS